MKAVKKAFGIDLRTLALYRVMLALMVLVDLLSRGRDLTAHYTDAGVLPRAELLRLPGGWRPSLHLVSGSATVEGILFAIAGVIALAFLVGYRTRLATFLCWLFLASLQARNPVLIQGGDNLLLLLLFWGMFLPLGARFSIDSALDRGMREEPNAYFSLATAALLAQCMSVYFFSALLKSGPEWWPDGSAVYQALHIDYLATPFAVWLRQFSPALTGLTYYVWFLELIGPFLIFSPFFFPWLRLFVQLLFITLHVGFFLCLEIGLFPFISIASLLAFTPGWVWDWLAGRLRTAERIGMKMYYDGECEFCMKVCLILRTMLLLPDVPILKAQNEADIHREMRAHDSWVVIDHVGTRHVRWQAVALAVRRSPVFWPIGVALACRPLARIGDRVYEAVARNRPRLGRLIAVWLPFRYTSIHPSVAANVVVGALTVLVLWVNIAALPDFADSLPGPLRGIESTLRLSQRWNMFAPAPAIFDGWFVVRGEREDKSVVDVLRRVEGEPSFNRPVLIAREYPNYRWRKYLTRIAYELGPEHRPLYAQYLCRAWNRGAPPGRRLARLSIYFNNERIEPDYRPRVTQRVLFHTHSCVQEPRVSPEKSGNAI